MGKPKATWSTRILTDSHGHYIVHMGEHDNTVYRPRPSKASGDKTVFAFGKDRPLARKTSHDPGTNVNVSWAKAGHVVVFTASLREVWTKHGSIPRAIWTPYSSSYCWAPIEGGAVDDVPPTIQVSPIPIGGFFEWSADVDKPSKKVSPTKSFVWKRYKRVLHGWGLTQKPSLPPGEEYPNAYTAAVANK